MMRDMGRLLVENLHPDVTEVMLHEKFSPVGPLSEIHLCLDHNTGRSLGHAYLTYHQRSCARSALNLLNFDLMKGKPIHIMTHTSDPVMKWLKNYGMGNISVNNLNRNIDDEEFYNIFSGFGNILSSKVMRDKYGVSKGYGFVQFDREDVAKRAIDQCNGMKIGNVEISIRKAVSREFKNRTSTIPRRLMNQPDVAPENNRDWNPMGFSIQPDIGQEDNQDWNLQSTNPMGFSIQPDVGQDDNQDWNLQSTNPMGFRIEPDKAQEDNQDWNLQSTNPMGFSIQPDVGQEDNQDWNLQSTNPMGFRIEPDDAQEDTQYWNAQSTNPRGFRLQPDVAQDNQDWNAQSTNPRGFWLQPDVAEEANQDWNFQYTNPFL